MDGLQKDELANIYNGKGTQKEKESVYEILFSINASQNSYWEKIKNKINNISFQL